MEFRDRNPEVKSAAVGGRNQRVLVLFRWCRCSPDEFLGVLCGWSVWKMQESEGSWSSEILRVVDEVGPDSLKKWAVRVDGPNFEED